MNNLLKLRNKYIGIHIKNNLFLYKNIILAKKFNINSFSFFIGNPLIWKKKINDLDIFKFNYFCKKFNIKNKYIIPHSSYLINLGCPIKKTLLKSINLLKWEIFICNKLNIKLINLHLGNHLKLISENKCIDNVINSINNIIKCTKNTILVLENSAGNGNYIGYDLNHISDIISSIDDKSRIGVCIDTGHAFAAGYDLRNFMDCDIFFNSFDKKIGFNFLKALHLNGSRCEFNSKKDKHSVLLNSFLGNNIFYWIMRNYYFNNLPIILETNNSNLWLNEINWLYSI